MTLILGVGAGAEGAAAQRDVQERVTEIWAEYLAPDASCPVNVDSHSHELTKRNMQHPDRWSFDTAAGKKLESVSSLQIKWKRAQLKKNRYAAKGFPDFPTCQHDKGALQCKSLTAQDIRTVPLNVLLGKGQNLSRQFHIEAFSDAAY
ncbi:hypothetical protein LSTR_LSTR010256 [Laodelphax striatellus]|uniref:RGS domain-containing protein n=1 Tax=Laodelphax striatellus TaxID=195883 RepID=A0A482WM34_LAOST|nr:hypothetical protein LSTR_LSTR010256 [Laodelphax striatellus]